MCMLKKQDIIEAIKEDMSSEDYELKYVEVMDMINTIDDIVALVLDTMREKGENKARLGNMVLTLKKTKKRELVNPKTGVATEVGGEEKVKISYIPKKVSKSSKVRDKDVEEE